MERVQRQAARFCKKEYGREKGIVTQLLSDLPPHQKEDTLCHFGERPAWYCRYQAGRLR